MPLVVSSRNLYKRSILNSSANSLEGKESQKLNPIDDAMIPSHGNALNSVSIAILAIGACL